MRTVSQPPTDESVSTEASTGGWRSHLWIWFGFALLYGAFDIGRQPEPEHVELVVRALVWAGLGALLSAGWRLVLSRLAFAHRSRVVQVGLSLVGAIVGGFVWLLLFHHLDGGVELEGGWEPMDRWERGQLVAEWLDYALVLLVWHGAVFALQQSRQASIARERALRAQSLATEMRLEALQAQLRPHFLFNAINAAMALIPEDPPRAERVLQHLADLLRGSLRQQNRMVPVREEMAMVGFYLDIEKTRYEDKLQIEQDVAPEALRCVMPAGSLLLLVDNAVKHGMPQAEEGPLRLRIDGRVEAERLHLSVYNSGRLTDQAHPQSLGIGLRNLRQSLVVRFGDDAQFELIEEGGVWAHLRLPRELEG